VFVYYGYKKKSVLVIFEPPCIYIYIYISAFHSPTNINFIYDWTYEIRASKFRSQSSAGTLSSRSLGYILYCYLPTGNRTRFFEPHSQHASTAFLCFCCSLQVAALWPVDPRQTSPTKWLEIRFLNQRAESIGHSGNIVRRENSQIYLNRIAHEMNGEISTWMSPNHDFSCTVFAKHCAI